MSAQSIRFHQLTLSFLPARRERKVSDAFRSLRLRVSQRNVKRLLRAMLP